jgi:hypothetical protein
MQYATAETLAPSTSALDTHRSISFTAQVEATDKVELSVLFS